MLVLTRTKNCRRIQIVTPSGEEIWITVTDFGLGKVRLGFECDPRVRITREELIEEGKGGSK